MVPMWYWLLLTALAVAVLVLIPLALRRRKPQEVEPREFDQATREVMGNFPFGESICRRYYPGEWTGDVRCLHNHDILEGQFFWETPLVGSGQSYFVCLACQPGDERYVTL